MILCSPKEQEENELLQKASGIVSGAKEEARQIIMKANQVAESMIAEANLEKAKPLRPDIRKGMKRDTGKAL